MLTFVVVVLFCLLKSEKLGHKQNFKIYILMNVILNYSDKTTFPGLEVSLKSFYHRRSIVGFEV